MTAIREALERFYEHHTFEEAIALLVIGSAALIAAVFALGRALTGAWIVASLDTLVVVIAIGSWFYVWRTGRATVAGRAWIVLTLGVVVAMAHLVGPAMLVWAYPLMAATFFLFRLLPATAIAGAAAAALAVPASALDNWGQVADFYGALLAVSVLAASVAASVRHSRAQLSALAERDPLTGASNRRGLTVSAAVALQRRAGGIPASLLLIDIDHFKEINDTYGHAVGDRILVELTAVTIATVRVSDDVFRYGGDELVVVAQGAAIEAAADLADKLRRRIAEAVLHEHLGAMVSVGVAEAEAGDTPASWLARADAMLYRAKHDGRNRVRVDCDKAGAAITP